MNTQRSIKSNHGKRVHPESPKPRAPHTVPDLSRPHTVDSILYLQRTIGNQAVQQLITPTSQSQTPEIQRAEIGLEQDALRSDFVGKGYAYWNDSGNKALPVDQFVLHLVDVVNAELETFGVPKTTPKIDEASSLGVFYKSSWQMWFSEAKVKAKGATVGDLTQEEAASLVDAVYHEARHAEQAFRIARMLADKGKSADEIANEMPIEAKVAEQATQNPLKNTQETAEEFAEAEAWHDIWSNSGKHTEYRKAVNRFDDRTFEMTKVMEALTESNFAETKQKVSTYMTEMQDKDLPFLESELMRVQAIKDPSEADEKVLGHLEKIISLATDVIIQWVDAEDATQVFQLQTMAKPLSNLWSATFNAYKDQSHEKDAWQVGSQAGDAFKEMKPEPAK